MTDFSRQEFKFVCMIIPERLYGRIDNERRLIRDLEKHRWQLPAILYHACYWPNSLTWAFVAKEIGGKMQIRK